MFYAGYDNPLDTDIAVFETEEERDEWVNDERSIFPRCAYSDEEVFYMDVDVWEDYEDVFGIVWKINPVG